MKKVDGILLVYNVFLNKLKDGNTVISSKSFSEIYSFSERFVTDYPVYRKSVTFDMFSHFILTVQNVVSYLKKRKIDRMDIKNLKNYELLAAVKEEAEKNRIELSELNYDYVSPVPDRLIDSSNIQTDDVMYILENCFIQKKHIREEKNLEAYIFSWLAHIYGLDRTKRQYSIGGFFGFKTDIDLNNGKIGLELKVFDKMSSRDIQRMFGQLIYYRNRVYNDNLILLICGSIQKTPVLSEIESFLKELNIRFVYRTAEKDVNLSRV